VQARDGQEALERFAAERIDLVVLEKVLGLERVRAEIALDILIVGSREEPELRHAWFGRVRCW